jgi:hypothetical protein
MASAAAALSDWPQPSAATGIQQHPVQQDVLQGALQQQQQQHQHGLLTPWQLQDTSPSSQALQPEPTLPNVNQSEQSPLQPQQDQPDNSHTQQQQQHIQHKEQPAEPTGSQPPAAAAPAPQAAAAAGAGPDSIRQGQRSLLNAGSFSSEDDATLSDLALTLLT